MPTVQQDIKYYLYDFSTPKENLYILQDQYGKSTHKVMAYTSVFFALHNNYQYGYRSDNLIGTITKSQLNMYLAINPDLTIKDLKALMENSHV